MKIIGTGIDIANISRIEGVLEKTPSFAEKILTPAEIDYCKSKRNYSLHVAGRFAAKEAVYKALAAYDKKLFWKDMEIISNGSFPVMSAGCKAEVFLRENGLGCNLSISHEKEYAVASAIVWKEE